jgi:hypothetical protein
LNNNLAPAPLTTSQIKRLKSLRPEAEPPKRTTINLGTFRLPERIAASLVRVNGSKDLYQVRVDLSGKALGECTALERIPRVKLDRRKFNASAIESVKPEGLRPLHVPVNFVPNKVKLKLAERSHPPVDFKDRKRLDRPTNVFPTDQRIIYNNTSIPLCTVGRVQEITSLVAVRRSRHSSLGPVPTTRKRFLRGWEN